MSQRPFEIVVFGATGFTGQLVAEYLARRRAPLRWAIAGRDRAKLECLREQLSSINPALSKLSLLIADAADGRGLRSLAEQTTTVCSAAGPFSRHGSELVAACVDRATHYCDISDESPWIRRMIDEHHAPAATRGVRIVHSCGYDSVPSDLGVLEMQRHASEVYGAPSQEVHALTYIGGCPPSGGRAATTFQLWDEVAADADVRRLLADPYGLVPARRIVNGGRSEQRRPGYDVAGRVFTAPFMLAPSNVLIVHRSNALLDYAYGRNFSYREALPTGKGARGAAMSLLLSASVLGLRLALRWASVRDVLRRTAPKSGEGPPLALRNRSFFAHELYGAMPGKRLRARVVGPGDPGYGESAKMLAESALSLALDADKLRSGGGVLTAASALGVHLIERLRAAGISISAWTEAPV
jgi:short subunit dehydrogenase-like uncharacterized protein